MKKRVLLLFCLSFILFSCKTIDLEKEMIDEKAPKEEEVTETVEEVNLVVPVESDEKSIKINGVRVKEEDYLYDVEPFIYEKTKYIVIDKKEAENKGLTGKDAVRQSMKDSMVTLENFTGGTSYYDYDENRQFPIFTKLLSLTTIMLNDDEYMAEGSSPYMSDTERWEITGDVWESDKGNRQLVMIKPKKSNLETNMMIVTNKRIYHFVLYSTDKEYQPMVRFTYPGENKFITSHTKKVLPYGIKSSYDDIDPSMLSFNYKVKVPLSSRNVEWIPNRVYDDGSHTYILLPEIVLQKEFPAIWENNTDIVNYEIDPEFHNLIIINKLINKVTLRVGKKKVTVVKKKGTPEIVNLKR